MTRADGRGPEDDETACRGAGDAAPRAGRPLPVGPAPSDEGDGRARDDRRPGVDAGGAPGPEPDRMPPPTASGREPAEAWPPLVHAPGCDRATLLRRIVGG